MAGVNGDENGHGVPREWHRWRGSVDEQLAGNREDVIMLRTWRQDHEKDCDSKRAVMHEKINTVSDRLARIETRVATYAGLGAALGGLVAIFAQWILGKL